MRKNTAIRRNLHKKSEIPEGETGWAETEFLETGYFQKESKVGKGDYNMVITPEDVDSIPVYDACCIFSPGPRR